MIDADTSVDHSPALSAVSAHSLRWLDAEQTRLDAVVQWADLPGTMPFTASETDTQAHTRVFMSRARAGDFGDIAPFVAPQPPSRNTLLAHAAEMRWRAETAGISVAGLPVATDDRSKVMLMSARLQASTSPSFTIRWKTTDGDFAIIDAATIITMSDAVTAHVEACFDREADVASAINEGDVTTIAAITAAFADVSSPWMA